MYIAASLYHHAAEQKQGRSLAAGARAAPNIIAFTKPSTPTRSQKRGGRRQGAQVGEDVVARDPQPGRHLRLLPEI